MTSPLQSHSRPLIVGYGLHGQAVVAALIKRGIEVVVVDDQPTEAVLDQAAAEGIEVVQSPDEDTLDTLMRRSTHMMPTPGLPDGHRAFAAAATHDVGVVGEFDLAAQWDDRPVVAITGTNGKTTVTTMVTNMLSLSGRRVVSAGNMALPLVAAIEDPDPEMFVVEASSFRLGHSSRFAPQVGTWLNFGPDHLDVHASLDAYESSKARIWQNMGTDDLAVANVNDPIVMRNVPDTATVTTFGNDTGAAHVEDGELVLDDEPLLAVAELPRGLPHDVSNALAAAVTALGGGATRDGVSEALRCFVGLQHRLELIGEAAGVQWLNDSKATTPHAVLAGLSGFDSVVLIAGGRNKGIDLGPLAMLAPRLRGVVAIGEAQDEVRDVLEPYVTVTDAGSMQAAVSAAAAMAQRGDVVVLSPACTSFDWYVSYAARGEDFTKLVRSKLEVER